MKENPQATFVDILRRSSSLSEIVYKVDQLAKLNRLVIEKLDPELSRHCRVANCREGILILTTTSPASGHLLRVSEMDLLSALRAEPAFCHLKSIKTQVRPSREENPSSKRVVKGPSTLTLSSTGANALRITAQQIASPCLQKALLQLAKQYRP